jgi:hypothetical protein
MREGQSIVIYIDKDEPNHIYFAGGGALMFTLIFGGCGGVCFGLGIYFMVKQLRITRLKRWLKHNGKRLRTTFVDVVHTKGAIVNDVHPVAIRTRYEENYRVYEFYSENLYRDPTPYIRAEMDVMVDPNDYSVYYMELETGPPPIRYG